MAKLNILKSNFSISKFRFRFIKDGRCYGTFLELELEVASQSNLTFQYQNSLFYSSKMDDVFLCDPPIDPRTRDIKGSTDLLTTLDLPKPLLSPHLSTDFSTYTYQLPGVNTIIPDLASNGKLMDFVSESSQDDREKEKGCGQVVSDDMIQRELRGWTGGVVSGVDASWLGPKVLPPVVTTSATTHVSPASATSGIKLKLTLSRKQP